MSEIVTSGTTGQRKSVVRAPEQVEARIARIALTRGPEFSKLKSFFCGFAREDAAFKQYETYCQRKGIALYGSTGDWSKTVALVNAQKPEGLLGPPSNMLRFARDRALTHKFNYLRASHVRLEPKDGKEILSALLAPGGAAYVGYGMSEMGGGFFGTFADAIAIPGCVGKPAPGVEYVIEADHQIRFKVNSKNGDANSYSDKVRTDKHFKTVDGALWFYPGDKARLQDGLLVLEGRV